jgi:outer membrane protein assembly factor BamB
MIHRLVALAASLVLAGAAMEVGAADWPAWRGPQGNGIAATARPPRTWSETTHIVWKAPVPGRGHASPIVIGDRIIVATADEQAGTQYLAGYSAATGAQEWKTLVHRGRLIPMHRKNSHASATPVFDGRNVYALFAIDEALHATALDLDGRIVWQKKVGPFESEHGYGSSPALYKSMLIVAADHLGGGGGYLAALDRASGRIVWKSPRQLTATHANYATPFIATVAGRPQLLIHGYDHVASYDPDTGGVLWRVAGPTHVCANTIVAGENHVYASGGYPQRKLLCIRADGSGDVTDTHVEWTDGRAIAYVPSPILHEGRLYVVDDLGVATCYNAADGQVIWRERIKGPVSASPILADGHLYVFSEQGVTTVLEAGDTLRIVAENVLPGGHMATPAFVGTRIYVRTNDALYCIAESP